MTNITEQQLTTYALGELPPDEAAAVEAHLKDNPDAQAYVDQIRATAATLTDALANEPTSEGIDTTAIDERLDPQPLYTFRRLALAASLLLAVGITVAVLLPSLGAARRTARQVMDTSVAQIEPPQNLHNDLVIEQPTGETRPPRSSAATGPPATPQPVITPKPHDEDGRHRDVMPSPSEAVELNARRADPKPENKNSQTSATVTEWRGSAGHNDNNVNFQRLGRAPLPGQAAPPMNRQLASTSDARLNQANERKTLSIRGGTINGVVMMDHLTPGSVAPKEAAKTWEYRPAPGVIMPPHPHPTPLPAGGEGYDYVSDNPFTPVADAPLSTFSIDVDTASYANVRRMITHGQLVPKGAVRIEEFINYFDYNYTPPAAGDEHPFNMHVEIASAPWQPAHRLVKVGLKGKELAADQRPAANLVFLIDVSGSMRPANKLPLVQQSLHLLVDQLNETDTVGIVTYAGHAGVALPPTYASDKETIKAAITNLRSGGSTAGAQGIITAYQLAEQHKAAGNTSRVILATDGDFNVGITDNTALTELIETNAKSGTFLSILGFGMGNLKDSRMEMLTNKGNGNYAYIDTLAEAKKVLVDQMVSTLVTIAKDVKLQVEFNPAVVHAYRLIGYENRILAKEDFNDDTKDAGEIGAGHEVTALYEIVPVGAETQQARPSVDPLKYQTPAKPDAKPIIENPSGEMLTLKLRYKQPDGNVSKLRQFAVTDAGRDFAGVSDDFRFAAAVAAFGMILRDSPHKGSATLPAILDLASPAPGSDPHGYRAAFVTLVQKVQQVSANH